MPITENIMDRILYDDKIFIDYEYTEEKEFEKHIIEHSIDIFGESCVYIDIKKRIGKDNILTIPDGYLIDFSFEREPRLYILENELASHDPYKHIGEQLLKFAISYKASGRKIKSFLLDNIINDEAKKTITESGFLKAGYRNIDAFLEDVIFEKPVSAVVIIDQITSDLENVLTQLTMKTDIIEFQTYICDEEHIHKYTPFQQEIRTLGPRVDIEEIDTIVVPANAEGFEETFLGEDCWYQIRISSSMLDRIKHIAAYQTAPVSAVTYFAKVAKIEKYKNTNKYIVYFDGKATKIGPVKLDSKEKRYAPQAPRYTSFKKLKNAKTLGDIF